MQEKEKKLQDKIKMFSIIQSKNCILLNKTKYSSMIKKYKQIDIPTYLT